MDRSGHSYKTGPEHTPQAGYGKLSWFYSDFVARTFCVIIGTFRFGFLWHMYEMRVTRQSPITSGFAVIQKQSSS